METEPGSTVRAASALKLWPSSPARIIPILFHSVMRNLNKSFQKWVCSSLRSFHSFLRILSSSEGCKYDCAKAQQLLLKLRRNSVTNFSLPIFPSCYLEHLWDLKIGYITQEIGNSETLNIKEKSKCPGESQLQEGGVWWCKYWSCLSRLRLSLFCPFHCSLNLKNQTFPVAIR